MKENPIVLNIPRENLENQRVFDLFELNYQPETLKTIFSHIESGKIPLIVSNHQSHADGLILAMITDKIKNSSPEKINGFYLPVAASMVSGDQNLNLKKIVDSLEESCRQKSLFMIPVTRPKDVEKYGIKNQNRGSLKKILTSHKNGFGLIFLPEGSVQAGRTNKDGNIFGMIKPEENNSFDNIIRKYLKNNIDFCIIPVAINGTHQLCNPDSYQITTIPTSKISATISENIFTKTDFENKETKPSDFIMPLISKMLPIESQGVYKL